MNIIEIDNQYLDFIYKKKDNYFIFLRSCEYSNYGESGGETLRQASLLIHQTWLLHGVEATELVLASLSEKSISEALLVLESPQDCPSTIFI